MQPINSKNGTSILKTDFPEQWSDLLEVLREFVLKRSEIEVRGGNKSPIARGLDGLFYKRGWEEKSFDIQCPLTTNSTPRRIVSRSNEFN